MRQRDLMGLLSQQLPNGDWVTPLVDSLGSIRGVVDDSLGVLEARNYGPYGVPHDSQGTPQTPYGFTGEMTDPNSLVYLRERYYDPVLGIFPSLDPLPGNIQEAMSLNPYMYVQGNPVNNVDPSGMFMENPGQWDSCTRQGDDPCRCCTGSVDLYLCETWGVPCSCQPPTPPTKCAGEATTVSANSNGQCCYQYRPGAAATYGLGNAGTIPSPGFENWGENGGDCANFVSQALRDGNLPMHEAFEDDVPGGWGCKTQGTKTCHATNQNWTVAPNLREYLVNYIHATTIPVTSPVSVGYEVMPEMAHFDGVQTGDILYIPLGSGSQHVALVVERGPAYASWEDFIKKANPLPFDVPYVVDHGFPAQGTAARPFYLMGWPPPTPPYSYFDATADWEFIRMSAIPERCVPADKIIPFVPLSRR